MIEIEIHSDSANQRLDRYMRKYLKPYPAITLSDIFQWIRKGIVKLNGSRASQSHILHIGDKIVINTKYIDSHKLLHGTPKTIHKKQQISRNKISSMIIYEDKHWLAINKPSGTVAHEGNDHLGDTNMNDILYLYMNIDKDNIETFKPARAYRLDRDTSGVLLAALDYPSLRYINGLIQDRSDRISKSYLAIVVGDLSEYIGQEIDIRAPIYKGFHSQYGRAKCFVNQEKGQIAHSIVKPIDTKLDQHIGHISLVQVSIYTGRMHQIRVHLTHLGRPILGDEMYGSAEANKLLSQYYHIDRQLLHCYKYNFIDMQDKLIELCASVPGDFLKIYGDIDQYI